MDILDDGEWGVGPHEEDILCNLDVPVGYRKRVENYIKSIPKKNLRKKQFVFISTNVLCADPQSSRPEVNDLDRDIYLPLEITLAKWTLGDDPLSEPNEMKHRHWIINPGKAPRGNENVARDHRKAHKIDFVEHLDTFNKYAETDFKKVLGEINDFLTIDRVVFSLELRHVRQDLGSLKWLNKSCGYRSRPVRVLSQEDLFVNIAKFVCPPADGSKDYKVHQKIARKLIQENDMFGDQILCDYHKERSKRHEEDTDNCTRRICLLSASNFVATFGNYSAQENVAKGNLLNSEHSLISKISDLTLSKESSEG